MSVSVLLFMTHRWGYVLSIYFLAEFTQGARMAPHRDIVVCCCLLLLFVVVCRLFSFVLVCCCFICSCLLLFVPLLHWILLNAFVFDSCPLLLNHQYSGATGANSLITIDLHVEGTIAVV